LVDDDDDDVDFDLHLGERIIEPETSQSENKNSVLIWFRTFSEFFRRKGRFFRRNMRMFFGRLSVSSSSSTSSSEASSSCTTLSSSSRANYLGQRRRSGVRFP